jgi:hypothetical protein
MQLEEKRMKTSKPRSEQARARAVLADDASSVAGGEVNVFDRLKQSQAREPAEFIATFQHNAIPEGDTNCQLF